MTKREKEKEKREKRKEKMRRLEEEKKRRREEKKRKQALLFCITMRRGPFFLASRNIKYVKKVIFSDI